MKFPDFSCFLETLTEEKIRKISDTLNKESVSFKFCLNPDTVSDNFSDLYQQLISKDFMIAIALLEEYHSWLCEQLDKE